MRMIMPTVEELASTRYRLMMRGYLNQSDVMRFVPCGQKRARVIMEEIKSNVATEGIENLDKNVILTSRLIKYLGLTEARIKDAYVITQKKLSINE